MASLIKMATSVFVKGREESDLP
uniref:Uncharacterized protein n=1 Tax=Anguilla anguilla TaxID=7936 RepID=A0A0E9QFI3_ANGAN